MKVQSIDEFREELIKLGVIKHELDPNLPEHIAKMFLIEGCTEEEIEEIRIAQGVEYLPEIYWQFLLQMGHWAGRAFSGSDYYYSRLLRLKDDARDLLARDPNLDFQLPDDAFVFFMHQGYEIHYFLTGDRDPNPPVYFYHELKGEPRIVWYSLLDRYNFELKYIMHLLDAEEARRKKRRERAEKAKREQRKNRDS